MKKSTLELIFKLFLLSMSAGETLSEVCPAHYLEQHERVAKGRELRETVELPPNLTRVIWHSPNISCMGETSYRFSQCDISGSRIACSDVMSGYQAIVLEAQDVRNGGDVWGRRAPSRNANSKTASNVATSSSRGQGHGRNKTVGYLLYLKILLAKRSFESLGSWVTYTTADGKSATLRAFRPQMVYTPVHITWYTCTNVTVDGVSYIYYELTVVDVAPLLECQLIGRPDIRFTYVYEPPVGGVVDDPSGSCSCLVPVSPKSKETRTFRLRAKTKGVRSINLTRADTKVLTSASTELHPFWETAKVRGHEVLLPVPGQEVITYNGPDPDLEPDIWKVVQINTSECMRPTQNHTITQANLETFGIINLDQKSCPMYMADGQVTNCRCHMTARGHAYSSDLRVAWREVGGAKSQFISTAGMESILLAFKYKGTLRKYHCDAKDSMGEILETLVYSPRDIDYRVKEQGDHLLAKLWVKFAAAVVNLIVFISHFAYTMWKKHTVTNQEMFTHLISPETTVEDSIEDEMSTKSD